MTLSRPLILGGSIAYAHWYEGHGALLFVSPSPRSYHAARPVVTGRSWTPSPSVPSPASVASLMRLSEAGRQR